MQLQIYLDAQVWLLREGTTPARACMIVNVGYLGWWADAAHQTDRLDAEGIGQAPGGGARHGKIA